MVLKRGKDIEVEGGITGKCGGEGVYWGNQHESVGGVKTRFLKLAECLYFESPTPGALARKRWGKLPDFRRINIVGG